MYVIRPAAIKGTPSALAHDLGCQTRRWPNRHRVSVDYRRDFIMAVVPPTEVAHATPEYAEAVTFARKNKFWQRTAISQAGIPAPAAASTREGAEALGGERFVVRPLRHSGGLEYRVTTDRFEFTPGTEYVSELYPKRREYRVIFVYGQPLIWMRKKPNEGIADDAPWGHLNSRFQTINDTAGSRLGGTDCVQKLGEFAPIRGAHICAADVLFNDRHDPSYAVLELNFCPGLDIDNNRAKVVEAVRHHVS